MSLLLCVVVCADDAAVMLVVSFLRVRVFVQYGMAFLLDRGLLATKIRTTPRMDFCDKSGGFKYGPQNLRFKISASRSPLQNS